MQLLSLTLVLSVALLPVAANPSVIQDDLTMALSYLRSGEYRKAEKAFKRLDKAAKGKCEKCLWGLANAYMGMEMLRDVEKTCTEFLSVATDSNALAHGHNLRGVALLTRFSRGKGKRRDLTRAERDFREALQNDGSMAIAHYNLGKVLVHLHREVEAVEELDRFLETQPIGPEANDARKHMEGSKRRALLAKYVAPTYPSIARQARISGRVILEIEVGTQGKVSNIRPMSGHPLLIQAAIKAVQQWQYRPPLVNGEPIPTVIRVVVPFVL